MIQHFTNMFEEGELSGDFVLAEIPEYSTVRWMNGTFQAGFDRFIEDHIGFRSFFVRLNNQIDFSFFNHVNAEGLVKGKGGLLYEYDYIRAYTGKDFIGKETIHRKLNKLKFLQDHLKSNYDIDIILILEPSKARVHPEFIPDRYLKHGISLSNYEYIRQASIEKGINLLDLNLYLNRVSDTIRYPVYPPYGIHWSEHTMRFITDTLVKFIESKRNIDMPDFTVENRFVNDSISDSDYDAGLTANLLFRPDQPELPYPFFDFKDDQEKDRPMVLAVADSYYWNIFNTRLPKHLFANQAFWYFNAKVYPDFYYEEVWTSDLDLTAEVEKQDVILLGITERFLYKFGWKFVDQLYEAYTPKYTGNIVEKHEIDIRNYSTWFDKLCDTALKINAPLKSIIRDHAREQAIKQNFETYLTWYGHAYYQRIIRENKAWYDSLVNKAKQKGVNTETQLAREADFVFKNNNPEIYKKKEIISEYIDSISKSEEWMEVIREKASQLYVSVDEMVKVDAEYMAYIYLMEETPLQKRVRHIEDQIRNTPEWLEAVRQKAENENVTLGEMIRRDATFIAKEQLERENQNE